jgi:hypothetical protein
MRRWMLTRDYIDLLAAKYSLARVIYPPYRYVDRKTLVCSPTASMPRGKFDIVGVYFIVRQSDVRYISYTRVRYSKKPVPSFVIFRWAREQIPRFLAKRFQGVDFSAEWVVAYTLLKSRLGPRYIVVGKKKEGAQNVEKDNTAQTSG